MPEILLIMPLTILTVFTVIYLILILIGDERLSWVFFIMLSLVIAGSAWLISSYNQPDKIAFQTTRSVFEVDGVQVISYIENGDMKVVNVNKEIGRVVPKDGKVSITKIKSGPYLGIDWRVRGKYQYQIVEE